MADTVGEATFLIKVRDLVTGPMKGIASKLSETMRDISKIATGNLLSTGIMKATDALKGFLAQGIATNMSMDNLNVTFTTMLGSQRKATKLMEDMVKFAAATPFELEGLAQNAAALLATGNVGEKEVIPMLKKLGDAAAGSTEGFAAMPRVVRAIAQMMSKGKLQAEEMNQLAEAGIPAWGALAKQMGMTTAEVMKLASKGKLGMKEIGMLVDGLGNKYSGLADKQSKTFSGMMSTLKDNVAIALAKMTRPIYDEMTKVMEWLAKYMASGAFDKGLKSITEKVVGFISLIKKGLQSPLVMAVAKIAMIAAGLIAAGAALAWVPTLAGLAVALAPTVAIITAITAAAAALGVMLKNAFSGENGEKLRAKLSEIWRLVKEIGLNIKEALLPVLQQVGAAISKAFGGSGTLQSGFNGFLNSALDGIKSILDVLSIVTTDFGKSWEFVSLKAAAAFSYITDVMRHLFYEQAPNMLMAFGEAFFGTINAISLGIQDLIPAFSDLMSETLTAYTNLLAGMLTALIEIPNEVMNIKTEIVKNFKQLFTSLAEYVGAVFDAVLQHTMYRINAMVASLKALKDGNAFAAAGFAKEALLGDGKTVVDKVRGAAAKVGEDNAPFINDMEKRIAKITNLFAAPQLKYVNEVAAAGAKFGDAVKEKSIQGANTVKSIFDQIRSLVPGFQKSGLTNLLENAAGGKWEEMRQGRNNKRVDRFVDGLGLDKIPGQIGGFLGDLFAKGGMGLFGGLEDALGLVGAKKKGGEAEKEKKKAHIEFVGYADMNKRMQTALSKEDKDKKAALAAAKKAVVVAEKHVVVGQAIANGVKGVQDGIAKLVFGFGK